MVFYCQNCLRDFPAGLPDGSCPDCYTLGPIGDLASVTSSLQQLQTTVPNVTPPASGAASSTGNAPQSSPRAASVSLQQSAPAGTSQNRAAFPPTGPRYARAMPKLRSQRLAPNTFRMPERAAAPLATNNGFPGLGAPVPAMNAVPANPGLLPLRGTGTMGDAGGQCPIASDKPVAGTNGYGRLCASIAELNAQLLPYLETCADPLVKNQLADLLESTLNVVDSVNGKLVELKSRPSLVETSNGGKENRAIANANQSGSHLKCYFCYNDPMTVLFLPCKHICACEKCSREVVECPFCRKKITNKENVFIMTID